MIDVHETELGDKYVKYTVAKVYDEEGNELPTQNEKPECTIHLDWTKKISFSGTLKPASIICSA